MLDGQSFRRVHLPSALQRVCGCGTCPRCHRGASTTGEESALRRWLSADPAHPCWIAASQGGQQRGHVLRRAVPRSASVHRTACRPTRWRRLPPRSPSAPLAEACDRNGSRDTRQRADVNERGDERCGADTPALRSFRPDHATDPIAERRGGPISSSVDTVVEQDGRGSWDLVRRRVHRGDRAGRFVADPARVLDTSCALSRRGRGSTGRAPDPVAGCGAMTPPEGPMTR